MDRKRKLDVYEQDTAKRFQANGATGQPALNPYTGRPYGARYYEILAKRKGQLSFLAGCTNLSRFTQRRYLIPPCRAACLAS